MNNKLYNLDCLSGMKNINDNIINVIFTSPPYAEQRKNVYEGRSSEEYIEWFIPIVKEFERVLSEDGSFFLNIKEHSNNGFRDIYVMKLIVSIVENTNFKLVDTFCWTKNAFPGKSNNKFKNAWEPVYHFSLNKKIKFFPKNNEIPIKNPDLYKRTRKKKSTKNGSGFAVIDYDKLRDKKMVLPSNHLNINNVINQYSKNSWHPATFPIKLVDFFIS